MLSCASSMKEYHWLSGVSGVVNSPHSDRPINHREMGYLNKDHQLSLSGPKDVCWRIHENPVLSAERLADKQLINAFKCCPDNRYKIYLCKRLRPDMSRYEPALRLKKSCYVNRDHDALNKLEIIQHKCFLQYLGDLQCLIQRCLESDVKLFLNQDLRALTPGQIREIQYDLNKRGVPRSNQINTYWFTQRRLDVTTLRAQWMDEEDKEIDHYNGVLNS